MRGSRGGDVSAFAALLIDVRSAAIAALQQVPCFAVEEGSALTQAHIERAIRVELCETGARGRPRAPSVKR
jgi:hypothetical protein